MLINWWNIDKKLCTEFMALQFLIVGKIDPQNHKTSNRNFPGSLTKAKSFQSGVLVIIMFQDRETSGWAMLRPTISGVEDTTAEKLLVCTY